MLSERETMTFLKTIIELSRYNATYIVELEENIY